MTVEIRPARADDPPGPVAELVWSTDTPLMAFFFGAKAVYERIVERQWPAPESLTSHRQTLVAEEGGRLLGLMVGFEPRSFERHAAASERMREADLTPAELDQVVRAFDAMERLFPAPRADAYYVFDLAVSPEAQGRGIGRRLLDGAVARARVAGAGHLALDVAADNPAVGFYRRFGLAVAIETRLPALEARHGIGAHLHMEMAL